MAGGIVGHSKSDGGIYEKSTRRTDLSTVSAVQVDFFVKIKLIAFDLNCKINDFLCTQFLHFLCRYGGLFDEVLTSRMAGSAKNAPSLPSRLSKFP